MPNKNKANGKRCGDFGGISVKPPAGPCGQAAGAGTEHQGTGLCRYHEGAPVEALADKKKEFLAKMKKDPRAKMVSVAAHVFGSYHTFFFHRHADPEFDAKVRKMVSFRDKARVEIVEDSVVARIEAGEESAAMEIFYLCNRAPDRWRNVKDVNVKIDVRESLAALLGVPPQALPEGRAVMLPGVEEVDGD